MEKKIIGIGIFKYDLFPYMIAQKIYGSSVDGDIKTDIGTFKSDSLITVFPKKQYSIIKKDLARIKRLLRKKTEEIKQDLLIEFYQKYPTSIRKEQKEYKIN